MFELMMTLPLFKGVSRPVLEKIIGTTKLHFLKYPDGELIVRAGEKADYLSFVISGSVRSVVENIDRRFSVAQILDAPAVLDPDFLFGRTTEYPCSISASGAASILKIAKLDYLAILPMDSVIMLNYLNYLAVNVQKCRSGLLGLSSGGFVQRLACLTSALTQPEAREIEFSCSLGDFCSLFGLSRHAVESSMKKLKERGIIDYSNGWVSIPDRRALMDLYYN